MSQDLTTRRLAMELLRLADEQNLSIEELGEQLIANLREMHPEKFKDKEKKDEEKQN